MIPFRDLAHAGRQLGAALERYRDARPFVVGTGPRGTLVAAQVARALAAPLSLWAVRDLTHPARPDCSWGALAEGGVVIIDRKALRTTPVSWRALREMVDLQRNELEDRSAVIRGNSPLPDVRNRTVILVDDGTSSTTAGLTVVRAIRARHPKRLVLALPVARASGVTRLRGEVDDLVCLDTTGESEEVGSYYDDRAPPTDEQLSNLLLGLREEGCDTDAPVVDGL